ncbi:hypothetical protein HWI79_2918 [Cryptosporidium felis]|nr:hypothetical protein HWI79_2918 [Cryptosporidium felis]
MSRTGSYVRMSKHEKSTKIKPLLPGTRQLTHGMDAIRRERDHPFLPNSPGRVHIKNVNGIQPNAFSNRNRH